MYCTKGFILFTHLSNNCTFNFRYKKPPKKKGIVEVSLPLFLANSVFMLEGLYSHPTATLVGSYDIRTEYVKSILCPLCPLLI